MVSLKIFKADGSQYWSDMFFNSLEECNAWVEQEKTRPYADPGWQFDVQVIDDSQQLPKDQAELALIQKPWWRRLLGL